MKNIFVKSLMIIVFVLLALILYKTFKKPLLVSEPMIINKNLDSQEYINKKYLLDTQEIVKQYILDNPEIIIKSIDLMQKRKRDEINNKNAQYIKNNLNIITQDINYPISGDVNSNIVIVSFYDYTCGYCKKGALYMEELIKNNPKLKIVYRPLPLLGKDSFFISSIALAVFTIDPSKFILVHSSLLESSNITEELLEQVLIKNQLDPGLVRNKANSDEIKKLLDKNIDLAKNLKIQGVPTYIIGNKLISGMLNLQQLEDTISKIINE